MCHLGMAYNGCLVLRQQLVIGKDHILQQKDVSPHNYQMLIFLVDENIYHFLLSSEGNKIHSWPARCLFTESGEGRREAF